MPIDLTALKAELQNDPLGKGYSGMSDEDAAKSLSLPTRQANRDSIDGGLLASCVVRSEYATLSASDRQYVTMLVSCATAIPLTAAFKAELGGVFPNGSQTRANLLAAVKRTGSRAEELNLGGNPTPSDVADARRA